MIKCPTCREACHETIECRQCCGVFCPDCQPFFDYEESTCASCQEKNIIRACRESAFTAKLRRLYSKPATIRKPPRLHSGMPWSAKVVEGKPVIVAGGVMVAEFKDIRDASWAARSANNFYQYSSVLAAVYNRIRLGHTYFDGSEADIKLWQELGRSLK